MSETPDTITLNAGWERCCGKVPEIDPYGFRYCKQCGREAKQRDVVLKKGAAGYYAQVGEIVVALITRTYGGEFRTWRLEVTTGHSDIPSATTPQQAADIINRHELLTAMLGVAETQEK